MINKEEEEKRSGWREAVRYYATAGTLEAKDSEHYYSFSWQHAPILFFLFFVNIKLVFFANFTRLFMEYSVAKP